jgi:hypothetical protein
MNKRDTERIVRKVAVLDNRRVDETVIDAWHDVVGHLSYDVAELALRKARQEAAIDWIEPRHIIAKSHDAVRELNDEARRLARDAEETGTGEPEPICRAHNLRITSCSDCCRRLWEIAGRLSVDARHAWAVANLYVEEPF